MTQYKLKFIATIFSSFLLGIIIGGYLFSKSQPRSFLAITECNNTCLKQNELLGLIATVGIQKFDGLLPGVVKETEMTIVLKHPFPEANIHYVVIPKKDIKDLFSITDEDQEYLADIFKTISVVIQEENLTKYKVVTYGSGYQQVTYLHFHLLAEE